VFSVLGGVVIETGGILAHATLVSREYGIPCVMNVSRATERITDGQIITIDGDAGRVILKAEARAADGAVPVVASS
jgi:pyruvate,water dikinase